LILDTNALSAFVDGDERVGQVLRGQGRAALPVIVLGEFRYGIATSRYRQAYEGWLRENLDLFELLDVTAHTAVVYAELRVEIRRTGRLIPANNAWIAARGIQHGLPVLSRDGHFDGIRRLTRLNWKESSTETPPPANLRGRPLGPRTRNRPRRSPAASSANVRPPARARSRRTAAARSTAASRSSSPAVSRR
jgi:tRNA(fMet)-specific endonuclease VapC